MAKSKPINTSNPAGNSDRRQGDDYIRTLAEAVAEILGVDHYIGANDSVAGDTTTGYKEDAAGEHAKITLRQASAPTNATDKGFVYTKDVSGATELFYLDEAGNEIQLTSGGKIGATGESATVDDLTVGGSATIAETLDITGNIDPTSFETTNGGFLDEDDMASDSATKVASQQSIKAYVDGNFPDDDAFGTWDTSTYSKGNNYEAASDGFVCAYASAIMSTNVELKGYTDATATPVRLVQRQRMNVPSGYFSIMFPVKKGDYWRVDCSVATTVYWLPVGG